MAASSQAATLSLYDFTGSVDTPTVFTGVTASDFTPADGIIGGPPTALFNGFSTTVPVNTPPANAAVPVRYVRGTAGSADTAAALTNGDYFTFTLAPTSGNQLSLQNFTVDISANGGAANADTAEYALFASTDGFASGDPSMSDILAPAASVTAPGSNAIPYTRYTVDLSEAAFQDLTGTVTFRLYVSNSSSSSVARFDDVTINGTVSAVPEPSGFVLLGLGAGVVAGVAAEKEGRRCAIEEAHGDSGAEVGDDSGKHCTRTCDALFKGAETDDTEGVESIL
ncbi:MAG: hypothetical protein WDN28_11340 [Chthoniobacter sp.]